MSAGHPRPDPVGSDDMGFWSHVAAGELRIQRCAACGVHRHPPRPVCASCGSTASEWTAVSGRGTVWACTVIHPPTLLAFESRTPYAAVVVRLDEGVFLVSNVENRGPEEVAVGMPVEVVIVEVEPGLALPLVRAVDDERPGA